MSWDRIEGQWKQRRGQAVHQWGKVMNDELAAIAGKYEELVGRLQEKYGVAKEETKQQIRLNRATVEQLKKSNSRLMELQNTLNRKKIAAATASLTVKTARKQVAIGTTLPKIKKAPAAAATVPAIKRKITASKG